ncbi:hypothetical protein M1D47_04320 [Bacillus sp. R1-10]
MAFTRKFGANTREFVAFTREFEANTRDTQKRKSKVYGGNSYTMLLFGVS